MAFKTASKNAFTVKAYQGDSKTLLAFNFQSKADAANLAGFTIQCQPPGVPAYYLWNALQFQNPSQHAQIATEPPYSSANAPIQKYRWTHVLGSNHQGTSPVTGNYTYTVTPRFFDPNGKMLALDSSQSVTVVVPVGPFQKGALSLGFTRGYMQSQAFATHFGTKTPVEPRGRALQFPTSSVAGTNQAGQSVTFADIYEWMGWSARVQVFDVLNQVLADSSLTLDVFAYDLDEPDIVAILFQLAAAGRIRIILDNASLHIQHTDSTTKKTVTPLEVPFAQQFQQLAKGGSQLLLGHFARYSHDKILIVSKNGNPVKVLTGSTNFSVTGLYVNANHTLVFDDPALATEYKNVFDQSWTALSTPKTAAASFAKSTFATAPYTPALAGISKLIINFSPHSAAYVTTLLGNLVNRINGEVGQPNGSVIFAVMQIDDPKMQNPVYTALNNIYKKGTIFSYGISDAPNAVILYQPATPQGVLVSGKPSNVQLPPPFNQVPSPPGHEIHDKFVVCGLNGPDPVVYCGSSNLANGGEQQNGDNLLEIHDADVAMAFAIEALDLIDHYNFLDRWAQTKATKTPAKKTTPSAATKSPAKPPAKKSAANPPKATKKAVKKSATRKPAPKKKAKKSSTRKPTPTAPKKSSKASTRTKPAAKSRTAKKR
ncbi:MAG TPA: phospholipase D-like domain-containing protein [Terracidiphilus sp.]|jgi:phosphatidylserine/phosphatidylglycerophosphate/cardiolipin synthase-like enzyme|nr:phospholipase D-like domain-containing protein [Terracidiphilus sp.]